MVVTRSLLPVMLRLIAVLCTVVIVGIGAATAASAQDTVSSEDSSGSAIDNAEVEDQGDDSGFDWLETGAGALSCANPVAALVGGLGNLVTDADIPDCLDAAGNVVDAGTGAIEDGINDAAAGAVEKTALWIGNAGVFVLKFALGWWATLDTVDASVFQNTVAQINDYTFYIQIAALGLSLILLGGRLALARSGMIRDTSEEGLRQMARATVIAGAVTGLIVIGTRLGDNLASWFMNGAVGSDPSRLAEAMVTIQLYSGPAGVGLLFVIGIIGILGGLVMAFLMLLRTGILVLMAAALPIAGAAGGTKVGSQAYEKMLAWTIAFLLVKPAGAFVIGVSAILFLNATPTVTDPESGDGLMALSGVILLSATALVLPALMRLIVPNVGALGGGGSGIAAAAGTVALGAKVGGMIATGGASGAASGAATTSTTSTTASNSPSGATPSGFGAAGGAGDGQAGGNQNGTPSAGGSAAVGSGGPQGNDSGTPGGTASGSSGSGGSARTGSDAPVATGAGHQFNRGGFEQ
ncbi:hypothetical protein MX572_23080 (plasmid) [Rhodococcus pyridinivorans]|uniref:hypothetical protein n=1 Tax=Rhodococcus TaxID=1827 RepID=UPI0020C5B9D8|nr:MULTISPECIES: hypothetical protein [Rhodococcus]UTM39746.1 hypothetical protein MX572_23080 [Rhodococcus pyridinivorans]WKK14908.1 hypothetical protein QYN14_26845 [Rhodococcus ruber]